MTLQLNFFEPRRLSFACRTVPLASLLTQPAGEGR